MELSMNMPLEKQFEYGFAKISDLRVAAVRDEAGNLPHIAGVELKGQPIHATPRFWRSFFSRFHVAENTFRYFSHAEVFQRISTISPCETFRYCLETKENGNSNILAISPPSRPLIEYEEVLDLIGRYEGDDITYHEGVVRSTHAPRSGEHPVEIGGDGFKNRYVLTVPIDGHGLPKIHLALLRLLCTNGAIGHHRAFRTDINLGKDIKYSVGRVLDRYDNDNGYAALWQRFESAQNSWASLREAQQLYKIILQQRGSKHHDEEDSKVIRDFYAMSGRPHELYGVANLDTFTEKRQRLLPTQCRVYDLINFASEIATHKSSPADALSLQGFIGGLVADEYDLEGTAEGGREFEDFLSSPDPIETTTPSRN